MSVIRLIKCCTIFDNQMYYVDCGRGALWYLRLTRLLDRNDEVILVHDLIGWVTMVGFLISKISFEKIIHPCFIVVLTSRSGSMLDK